MQDALVRDMFSISDINNPRYNGHVQISSCGKVAGGKRDRKGCTKGKIEAIMKNNIVRPKVCVNNLLKKSLSTGSNHSLFSNHSVKAEQEEDPYTFTEPEPQVLSLYQPSGSSNKKSNSSKSSSANMVCQEKNKLEHSGKNVVKLVKAHEGTSKMNKLQAEIARSKVIGKRRKVGDQTPQRPNEWSSKREPGKVCISAKRKSTWQQERNSKHELLERIHQVKNSLSQYTRDLYPLGLELSDSDSDSEPGTAVYERSWFCRAGDGLPRERRVEETKASLRRRLNHTVRALQLSELPPRNLFSAVIDAARRFPSATAAILDPSLNLRANFPINRGSMFLLRGEKCSYPEGCDSQALPCTRHCLRHIMYNVDQRLFSHCTAKYPDNTQCTTPVFDVLHHLPLCHKHAKSVSVDAHRLSDSRSSKKVSKKSRMLGSSKRNNKKRKKLGVPASRPAQEVRVSSPVPTPVIPEPILQPESVPIVPQPQEGVVEEVPVEEVLAIASMDPAELASQATRLLEEHDLTNVLNQLSADAYAFNDLFIDKNGEYEPTREETEELERALEAVNQDVRSLETLTRSLPLLHSLPLDTMALLDDSTTFPGFHNGFPPPQTHQS